MKKIILKKDYIELEKIQINKVPLDNLSDYVLYEQMNLRKEELRLIIKLIDSYNKDKVGTYENDESEHYKYYLKCLKEEKYENLIIYEIVD